MFESFRHAFQTLRDVEGLVRAGGLAVVCGIIFTETGLFLGFFLPGDSLLVTAGILAAAGHLSLAGLLSLVTLCAILGDQLNYFVGRQAGQALYARPDSFFFKKKHLERAHEFYEKYGVKTIIIARFVPIVRTFCPAVAGAARMTYRTYLTFDVVGGMVWVFSMVLGGFFLGRSVPNVNEHLHIVIAVVVFLSLLPAIIEGLRLRRSTRAAPAVPAVPAMPEEE
ncbi:MAG TPA: VTT domain-containing protein [Candidatus Acidoferrales bacterium]|nr:VTT domain-containing protein [Candidatus Acidoferrales bacterium]